jgi:hypothetical protein
MITQDLSIRILLASKLSLLGGIGFHLLSLLLGYGTKGRVFGTCGGLL